MQWRPAAISAASSRQNVAGGAYQAKNSSNPDIGSMFLTEVRVVGDAHSSQRDKRTIEVQQTCRIRQETYRSTRNFA